MCHDPSIERPVSTPAQSERATPPWAVTWLIALVVATVAVRVADPTPWLGSDDAAYHSAAEFLLEGKTIERVHHQYARFAVIVPIALSIAVLGNNVTAVVLPTLIVSILCVALVVMLGRMLWGWWEGLFAATVVAFLPFYRVLSTTAYPEVHVCFWSTLAILLALNAARSTSGRHVALFGVCAGVSLGVAVSAKVFAVFAIVGVAAVVWTNRSEAPGRRLTPVAWVLAGGAAFFLLHGLFCAWATNDFWFKLHALQSAERRDGLFPPTDDPMAVGLATFAWRRLVLLFHTSSSGWGSIAVLFWPAALLAALCDRRGRGIAVWAIAGYALLAFLPVSFRNGPRPYPSFVGRDVLMVCVPFALCLAWAVRITVQRVATQRALGRIWPVILGIVAGTAYANPTELDWFRDRHTSRVAAGVRYCIAATPWDTRRDIYMTPSMYWRFRVLFPPTLRERLRVAVEATAPDWWRLTTTDIVERFRPLPAPGDAYLLATPEQLAGGAEVWDYFVPLPGAALDAWRRSAPLQVLNLGGRALIVPACATADNTRWRLMLLGGDALAVDPDGTRDHDPTAG